MPTSLPKHPALIIRDLLRTNWTPGNCAGYDPSITDPDDGDFLALSRGWYSVGGGADPYVGLTNFGEGVVNGGASNISAAKGDGSGYVQFRTGTGLATVFAERDADYNGERAADIVDQIRRELERVAFEDATEGGTTDLTYFNTAFEAETTDTDPSPPVEFQQVSIVYGWDRE